MGLVIKRGFWLVVAVVVSLLWVEVFTRVLLPQSVDTVVDIQQADSVLGFSYIPDAEARSRDRSHDVQFNINSLGLRNCEIEIDKGDVFRVLVLGNSFAVSHGCEMEESLPAAFERALIAEFANEIKGRTIEVINAANFGYRTFNYWRGYQRWADVLNPDAVVVAIVPSIDYITFPDDTNFIVQDGLVVGRYRTGENPVANKLSIFYKVRKKLARNSESYVLLRNFIYYNEKFDKLIGKKGEDKGSKIMLASYETPISTEVASGWNKSYEYISRMKADADNDSIPLVVLLVPGKAEIDKSCFLSMLDNKSVELEKYDVGQPNRVIKEFCDRQNIRILNPHDDMLMANETSDVYFEFDAHWNKHGIKVATKSMAKQWRELGLPIE